MSRNSNPFDQAIETSYKRAKRALVELTATQEQLKSVLASLEDRPELSRLQGHATALEKRALKTAKQVSEHLKGCRSHDNYGSLKKEFRETLSQVQKQMRSNLDRQELRKLTPSESFTPSTFEPFSIDGPSPPRPSRPLSLDTPTKGRFEEQKTFNPVQDQIQLTRFDVEDKQRQAKQMQKLSEDVMDLQETFQELNQLVHEQQPALDEIEVTTEMARDHVHNAKNEVLKASKYQNNSRYLWGGALVGGLLGGPVGACVGLKAAATLGVSGAVLGTFAGRSMAKAENNKIDAELREPWNPQESRKGSK